MGNNIESPIVRCPERNCVEITQDGILMTVPGDISDNCLHILLTGNPLTAETVQAIDDSSHQQDKV